MRLRSADGHETSPGPGAQLDGERGAVASVRTNAHTAGFSSVVADFEGHGHKWTLYLSRNEARPHARAQISGQ
jgi:hypothetical protein